MELSEKRTQCVHTQGFTELAWPSTESNVEENDSSLQVTKEWMALWPVDHAASVHVQVPKDSTNWPARECDVTMFNHGSRSKGSTDPRTNPPPTTLPLPGQVSETPSPYPILIAAWTWAAVWSAHTVYPLWQCLLAFAAHLPSEDETSGRQHRNSRDFSVRPKLLCFIDNCECQVALPLLQLGQWEVRSLVCVPPVIFFLRLPIGQCGTVSQLSRSEERCTGPFNWGEAHCAGEKVKRKIGPFLRKSLKNQTRTRTQPKRGAARHGNQEPPGQAPRCTGQRGKNHNKQETSQTNLGMP